MRETKCAYNFKTRTLHKVFSKTVNYPLAKDTGKFTMVVRNRNNAVVEELSEDNGRLVRLGTTLIDIKEHKENKPQGLYKYNLCYIENGLESLVVEGLITVSKD